MKTGEDFYLEYVNGNDNAFEQVMRIYYDRLVLFINGYTHSLSDAEDIASECFLYIAIHKRRYNFKTSLKTYLYLIGRSKALNFLKRKRKNLNIEDYAHLHNGKDEVDLLIENNERRLELYRALEELPTDMQSIVYLFYFQTQQKTISKALDSGIFYLSIIML